jgi:hypothetical protein
MIQCVMSNMYTNLSGSDIWKSSICSFAKSTAGARGTSQRSAVIKFIHLLLHTLAAYTAVIKFTTCCIHYYTGTDTSCFKFLVLANPRDQRVASLPHFCSASPLICTCVDQVHRCSKFVGLPVAFLPDVICVLRPLFNSASTAFVQCQC